MRSYAAVVLSAGLLFCSAGFAQRNEVGLLLGSNQVPVTLQGSKADQSGSEIHRGLAYQATFAHTWPIGHAIDAGLEVPLIAIPSEDVRSPLPGVPGNYASLFITPGLRVCFLDDRRISPWAAVGGGYARFAESTTLVSGQPNLGPRGTNTGALQFGGGADFKTPIRLLRPIDLRGEVRDFYTGLPHLQLPRSTSGQHNVVISGGFVVRF
ncbi:MAG: hypothetical protein ACR2JE_03070 [Acidobacteriaceae bacterium]